MKIEIEDKDLFDRLITKLMESDPFKARFDKIIREQIKIHANEFYMLGYKKGKEKKK